MNVAVRELTADELDLVSGAGAKEAAIVLLANATYGMTGAYVAMALLLK